MDDLQQTLARLMILDTLHRYAWGYDSRDLALMGNAFAPGGSFAIELAGSAGWGPYVGRQQIVDWLAGIMAQQADQRRHNITNPIFRELQPASAVVDSFLCLTAVDSGSPRLVCTGTYRDELILLDGHWLIQRKVLRLDNAF